MGLRLGTLCPSGAAYKVNQVNQMQTSLIKWL